MNKHETYFEAHILLDQAATLLGEVHESLADMVRDIMDCTWDELSEADKARLGGLK